MKTVHSGVFTIPAGSLNDVAVSNIGFEPTGFTSFAGNEGTADTKVFGTSHGSAGSVADQACVAGPGSRYAPLIAAAVAVGQARDGYIVHLADDTLAEEVLAKLKSFDADGFTVEIDTNSTSEDTVVVFTCYRSA